MANPRYDGTPSVMPRSDAPIPFQPDNSNIIGSAINKLSTGLTQAGAFFDQAAVDDMLNQYDRDATNLQYGDSTKPVAPGGSPDTGYFGTVGRDALDKRPIVEKNLEDLRKKYGALLKNPTQKAAFDNATTKYITTAKAKIGIYADAQSKTYMSNVNSATADNAIRAVSLNADDPVLLKQATADLINARIKNAELNGAVKGDAIWTATLAGARAEALKARVLTISVTDPTRALGILETNKSIAGDEYAKLYAPLKTLSDAKLAVGEGDPLWDSINVAQTQVASAPEQFDAQLDQIKTQIHARGLSEEKTRELERAAELMLGRSWIETQMRSDPAYAKAQLGVAAGSSGDASDLIKSFEGIRTSAYPDTRASTGEFDAYRVGYGSDTITLADGTVQKVTASTVITQADAERDLQRRTKEFEATASGQVGAEVWASLPTTARAGLTSVAYNYGSLPNSVVAAVKTGDVNAIADAVGALDANPDRRAREAAVIRGQAEPPAPQVANMPYNERLKYYDQANADEVRLNTQQAAAEKAQYDAVKGGLELAIENGEVPSKQSIFDAPLSDGDKATLLNKWQAQEAKNGAAQAVVDAYTSGAPHAANPYDSDQRKVVGDAFDLLMKTTPDEAKPTATIDFVRSMGVVPDPVIAAARGQLASTDPGEVAKGLELASILYDAAPKGLDAAANGKEVSDAALTYSHYINDLGRTPTQAAQSYILAHDQKTKEKIDVLKKRWTEESKKFSVSDVLGAFGDNMFPGGPVAGMTPAQEAAITDDYLSAVEEQFLGSAQGDAGLANTLALAEMKKTYGISKTSGSDVIMKYPPENFYPVIGEDQSYIRDLALKEARSVLPAANDVMLVSTPETAQDVRAKAPPRYNLFYKSPNGVWDMASDMFQITPQELQQLDAIETEKRRIGLEVARQFAEDKASLQEALRGQMPTMGAVPFSPLGGLAASALLGLGIKADINAPGFAAQKRELDALEAQRKKLLGQTVAPDAPLISEEEMQGLKQQFRFGGM